MTTPTHEGQECLDAITQLFACHGDLAYGEDVTQLEHALQCAHFAEVAGAPHALIVACLLHDVGHMLHRDAGAALAAGVDDRHERVGAGWLARGFPMTVTGPIALHVQAKRFLVATDTDYAAGLSAVSRRTLEIQGGPMTQLEQTTFLSESTALAAITLRRCDELGKRRGLVTADLAHYLAVCRRVLH